MKIYKYISTIKNKDVEGNKPTHSLVAKESKEDKKGKYVASLWARSYENNEGEKINFLSGETKNSYSSNGEEITGYVIVGEAELKKILKVYEDHLIKQRNSEYPTPTDKNIDIDTMEAIFNGEIKPENSGITQEDVDNIPF